MLVSLKWINSLLKNEITEPIKLAEFLTAKGLEVEEIIDKKQSLLNIVTGRIIEKDKHPNSEKLSLLKVDIGKEVLQIVCGATNQKQGDIVAVACNGATLPNGLTIKKSKIRDVESNGMCCSYEELCMEQKSDGIIILQNNVELGKPIYEVFGKDDVLLNISVYPNRGDLLGHIGIAREVLRFNLTSLKNNFVKTEAIKDTGNLKVKIEDERCFRYLGKKFNNVKIKKTPAWLVEKLESVGLRSINNIVDISNYLMLEYGQPLHIFDADKILDSEIIVRSSNADEGITLLDDKNLVLKGNDILITSKTKVLALAGIMGCLDSGVSENTKNIILECASFDPSVIRTSARKYNLSTDSSFRFERGIDTLNMETVVERATSLIKDLAEPETIFATIDVFVKKPKISKIIISYSECSEFLGIDISEAEMFKILENLDFKILSKDAVEPPSYRNDINIKEDVYEEILRIYGFDKVKTSNPNFFISTSDNSFYNFEFKLKNAMKNLGFLEAINYSFISKNSLIDEKNIVELINPISDEMKFLRTSLLSSLLNNLKFNLNHRNLDIKLFELGKTYYKDKEDFSKIPAYNEAVLKENYLLAALVSGRVSNLDNLYNFNTKYNYFSLKGDLETLFKQINLTSYQFKKADLSILHPGVSSSVYVCNNYCGSFGLVHPLIMQKFDITEETFYFELDFEVLAKFSSSKIKYKQYSKLPRVRRDLSFLINETVVYSEIEELIKKLKIVDLENFFIFDRYSGKNIPESQVSLAMGFVFSNNLRTLTDKDVETAMLSILNALKSKFSIEIR